MHTGYEGHLWSQRNPTQETTVESYPSQNEGLGIWLWVN
jgi:hypothetical protein